MTKVKNTYLFSLFCALLLLPFAHAVDTGVGITPGIVTEDFPPLVWLCDNRLVTDDNVEWGRVSEGGEELMERINNYAFEGEAISWVVLVMDKNGIQKVTDVYGTIGTDQSGGGSTTITRTATVSNCDSIPLTNTDWDDNLVLNKFDSSLGTLANVEIELNTAIFSIISIQNQDVGPITVTLDANGVVNIDPIDGPIVTTQISISEDFVANQGMNNFEVEDSDSESYTASDLDEYIAGAGDTTFDLPADASATAQLSGSGNFIGGVSTQASAEACVIYTYEYEVTVPGGNDIEVNCVEDLGQTEILDSCNARILEEEITEFDPAMMRYYICTLTVETPESMYGEYWVTIEAVDLDGLFGTMDENEYWFFNPVIALAIDGTMTFENVRPGTDTYSDTLLVGNDAELGSGVMMDMFISGTDFYDSSSSAAACPNTNQLALSSFRYFATNGAYSTYGDMEVDDNTYDPFTDRDVDTEGYVNIQYGDHFDRTVYDEAEILQDQLIAPYYIANILAPGAEMALTFKLSLPEPCNGDFDTGAIYFWGEAI